MVKITSNNLNLNSGNNKKDKKYSINKRSKTIGLKKKLIGTVKFRTHKELIELQFDLEKR